MNFGSKLALPLVLLGLLLDWYSATATPDLGFRIAMVGVVLYGGYASYFVRNEVLKGDFIPDVYFPT